MITENLSSERLVSRKHHATRIASGVGHWNKLKEAHHILIVEGTVVKFL